MGYIKQNFINNETILTAEMLQNIENGILTNETDIETVKALVNGDKPSSINGEDFTDGLYFYGQVGDIVAHITNSSKMAGYGTAINISQGQLLTFKIYTNATVGYIFADDDNKIINTGSPSGQVTNIAAPPNATKFYINTLKTEKANSYVTIETSTEKLIRQCDLLIKQYNKSFQFEPNFDLTNVPEYSLPSKSTVLGCDMETIYSQYDELVERYPNYITKINCDNEFQTATGITKPEQLNEFYPIYLYKFSPTRGRNSTGADLAQRKKVFITSMHPQERLGIWVMAKTLAMICENWKEDYNAELLYSLIDFYVIPIAWPYNFSKNSRVNYNGVNPNRNFPTKNWYETNTGSDYSGPEPSSEYETKLIMYYHNQIKPDVTIDVHTSGHDNNGCMGIILCPNDVRIIDLCTIIARTTSNVVIKTNPTFELNDPNLPLYGVYPEMAPPPGEFYQWANEQNYGISFLTEESPYINWQNGEFLGANGTFVEEYTNGIFRQQIQYLFNCILRAVKYQCE